MTSVVTLAPALQYLVDARLDSIERALLSTDVSRAERRGIVQSVEDQVLELLNRLHNAEPTRDDVLAVLATIDPPEAFVPINFVPGNRQQSAFMPVGSVSGAERPRRVTPLAVVSCVLGIVSWLTVPIIPVFAVAALAATICGTIALSQIYYSNRSLKGIWPSVVGVSSPAVAMLVLFVLLAF